MAYASKLLGKDSVFLCNFGDGATSTGDFHEALNFAGIHKLAVVFVCENNGYAISVPLAKQAGNTGIYLRAPGYGMTGVQVDGSDVPAVYAVAREAVRRARAGEGPTLIEARIKRINSHTSEDNQARYRTAEDIAEALEQDPVAKFEAWLAGVLDQQLGAYARANGLGRVVPESLFRINPEGDPQRRPDVAFVSYERWPRGRKISSTSWRSHSRQIVSFMRSICASRTRRQRWSTPR